MKKRISILLAFCLCTALCGCRQETVRIDSPVNFYYRQAEMSDGVIGVCTAEGAGYEDDLPGLINIYLLGPSDPAFSNPFPSGSRVMNLTVKGSTANIQLNSSFARFGGIELTVACACLSLTVMELTETEAVHITVNGSTLDGAESITMTAENIILLDLYDSEAEE